MKIDSTSIEQTYSRKLSRRFVNFLADSFGFLVDLHDGMNFLINQFKNIYSIQTTEKQKE